MRFARGAPLEDVVRTTAAIFAVPVSQVVRVCDQENAACDAAIWCTLRLSGARQAQVAEHFGYRSTGAVAVARDRIERRLERDSKIEEAVKRIAATLRAR